MVSAPSLPMVAHDTLCNFVNTNENLVHAYVYRKLKTAIADDLQEIVLFQLQTSDLFLTIKKADYELTLTTIISSCLKREEYEMMARCKKLLNRLYINRVIEASKE